MATAMVRQQDGGWSNVEAGFNGFSVLFTVIVMAETVVLMIVMNDAVDG